MFAIGNSLSPVTRVWMRTENSGWRKPRLLAEERKESFSTIYSNISSADSFPVF